MAPLALQADVFELDMGEEAIGDLERIDIGFATEQSTADSMKDAKWFLSTVEVQHLGTGHKQIYLYENWVSSEAMPRVEMNPWQEGDMNVYKVGNTKCSSYCNIIKCLICC